MSYYLKDFRKFLMTDVTSKVADHQHNVYLFMKEVLRDLLQFWIPPVTTVGNAIAATKKKGVGEQVRRANHN